MFINQVKFYGLKLINSLESVNEQVGRKKGVVVRLLIYKIIMIKMNMMFGIVSKIILKKIMRMSKKSMKKADQKVRVVMKNIMTINCLEI